MAAGRRPGSDPRRPRTARPRADVLRGWRQRRRRVHRRWGPASRPPPQDPAPRPRTGTGDQERLRSPRRGPRASRLMSACSRTRSAVIGWVGRIGIRNGVAPEVETGRCEKNRHPSPDPPAIRRKEGAQTERVAEVRSDWKQSSPTLAALTSPPHRPPGRFLAVSSHRAYFEWKNGRPGPRRRMSCERQLDGGLGACSRSLRPEDCRSCFGRQRPCARWLPPDSGDGRL